MSSARKPDDPIAIVGMGCLFPGCESPAQLWERIESGTWAISDVPEGRWVVDARRAFDPRIALADHVYSTKGGFVAIHLPGLDTADLGLDVDGQLLERLDPLFHLVIYVASSAWRDARTEAVDRARAGIVFGNIVLPTETASAWSRALFQRQFEEGLGICPSGANETHALNAFPAGLPAAMAARALRLGGVAYTLDAACGSSLYALKLAVDELRSGRADAMICGGVSRPDPLYTQMGFSQLRALSARGTPAPFDAEADGLVVGEGAGMFVLKRLPDALAHGDRIYGIVTGIGLSNDVHGDLLAPSAEGQLRAMRQAYQEAGWSPGDVDLIECHATGTPRGDGVELESLGQLWRDVAGSPRTGCVIGSVKSNIGHTLTAAGSAGLIKVLLALGHRMLPPSANFRKPHPDLAAAASPFRVLAKPESWPSRASGGPRRAAVSGFGFGGVNAHVLIEEWVRRPSRDGAKTVSGQGTAFVHHAEHDEYFQADQRKSRDTKRQAGGDHAERDPDSKTEAERRQPIAIVGMACQFGPVGRGASFQDQVLGGGTWSEPAAPTNWWGVTSSQWYRDAGWDERSFRGYYLDSLEFGLDQFRIPPKELPEILPQQSLMLDVAARALREAGWQSRMASRTGVLIGLGLDLNTANYHWRWLLPELARSWCKALGLDLDAEELAGWVEKLRAAGEPALSANRTIGSLGGVVASRIAREFQIGGPSFSVSCDETSGIQALAIAARWLDRRELDVAVVGAVDLAGDVRAVLARAELGEDEPAIGDSGITATNEAPVRPAACDGAVCLILKRLDDAERDGDRIVAVIRDVKTCRAEPEFSSSPQRPEDQLALGKGPAKPPLGYLDIQSANGRLSANDVGRLLGSTTSDVPDGKCAIGSVLDDLGRIGAATGLAAVAKAAVCLQRQIIPGGCDPSPRLRFLTDEMPSLFLPDGRQFWLRNRDQGPRRSGVYVGGLGGIRGEVVLEEFELAGLGEPSSVDACQISRPRACGLFVLAAADQAGLSDRVAELRHSAREASCSDMDALAWRWWQRHPGDAPSENTIAIVAGGLETLNHLLNVAADRTGDYGLQGPAARGGIHDGRQERAIAGRAKLAFVFPGLGSHFAGMGRELSAIWPGVVRRLERDNRALRDQFDPAIWWSRSLPAWFADHRIPILANVWVGSLVTEILGELGVCPHAAIGYSMGESTALLSLGAWTNREELLSRIRSSSLFKADLAGPCEAARRLWELHPTEAVDWAVGIVPRPAEAVEAVIPPARRVYVLARNTADESVIGGQRQAVDEVVKRLRTPFVELPHVSTVHCEIGRVVEGDYRALHDLETIAPAGIEFYSGVWGRAYPVDRRIAAEAITAQATHRIDFPAVVERAYEDGIRVFLEVGPGSSCTRLIGRILGDRPHLALSVCRAEAEPYHAILEVLGTLLAWRVPVDLSRLYGPEPCIELDRSAPARRGGDRPQNAIRVAIRAPGLVVPRPPRSHGAPPGDSSPLGEGAPAGMDTVVQSASWPPIVPDAPRTARPSAFIPQSAPEAGVQAPRAASVPSTAVARLSPALASASTWADHLYEAERATIEAHRAFLRASQHTADVLGKLIAYQFALLQSDDTQAKIPRRALLDEPIVPQRKMPLSAAAITECAQPDAAPFLLNRDQCLEFAVGSIAAVLGPDYAAVDRFPTRVRLPDEPLLLVDRILEIEGEPRSLQEGRVVTEHVVKPDAWYLDNGKAPACIAIEAGQADLFLSAYLGADFVTEGRGVYRLLDATVTFQRGLPQPGDVIRYDIRIARFFRQGDTVLFRFQFDATIRGEPLLIMRDGCAGFFSAEELALGKGVVRHKRDLGERHGSPGEPASDLVPMTPAQLDEWQVDALRAGDLAAAFGWPFDRVAAIDPVRLPAGRLALLHRVSLLDPKGGAHRLGMIRAEADIRPGDWYLVCHFVDDQVMPGTLMYESCLHALRILLMRIGWVGPRDQVAFEPVVGIANRLRCRGQVIESTRVVAYEVTIKELRYEPQPYAVAHAFIFADGKPIVEISGMAIQLSGTDRRRLEQIWAIWPVAQEQERACQNSPRTDTAQRDCKSVVVGQALQPDLRSIGIECPAGKPDPERATNSGSSLGAARPSHALFDRDRLVEFAVGKPSAAFGERYRPFDEGRFIARLPAPPFQFLDRITRIDAEAWVMAAGSAATAEYDIPPDAWYFEANRQESVPHGILLEAALQACGWLAAYMGSALHSDDDLKFRILGGRAMKHRQVTRQTGTLWTRVKAAKISKSAGMILQQYEYSIHSGEGVVYDGRADLGFFHPRSLDQPEGFREAVARASHDTSQRPVRSFAFPAEAPFPESRWRMVDEVLDFALEGPPHGFGLARGVARVDPDSWLFQAHFLDDPVWPGSLGQEALLQLLKIVAARRWGVSAFTRFESPGVAVAHEWTYRGQITPENRLIGVDAEIKQVDDGRRWLLADGHVVVDGRVIYRMRDFSLGLDES